MKVYSRYTIVTVNFAEISLLGQNEQFGPNLGKHYATLFCNLDLHLRIFLRYQSNIREFAEKGSVLGQIDKNFKKILFSRFYTVFFNKGNN